jgi:hypothetical protein
MGANGNRDEERVSNLGKSASTLRPSYSSSAEARVRHARQENNDGRPRGHLPPWPFSVTAIFSWFDAHLWAYTEHYGLEEIVSEDFEHGRLYGSVRVGNPFQHR